MPWLPERVQESHRAVGAALRTRGKRLRETEQRLDGSRKRHLAESDPTSVRDYSE